MHAVLKRGGKRRGNIVLNLREVPTSSLIIKRLKLTPFQRASPPACLRYLRGARSPHLPKCPTAEHQLDLGGNGDRHLPFPKLWLGSIHPGHSAAFLPPKWRQVTVAVVWQDVTPRQGACRWPTGHARQVRPQAAPATETALATASGSREAQEQFLATFPSSPQVWHQA